MEAEVVSHELNHAQAIAELYTQNEALRDPAERRDYFASLEVNDFLDLLQQLNSTVRTGGSNQRQHFDGATVGLGTHDVPDQRDKEQLLKETWDVARSFLTDTELDDDQALAYAGLVAAGGILLTHPFIDSNGRVSRVISHMIMRGCHEDAPSEIRQLFAENGRSAWDVMPLANQALRYANYPYKKSNDLPEKIIWPDSGNREHGVVKDAGEATSRLMNARFEERALHMFMLHTDDKAREVIRQYIHFDGDQPIYLDAAKALTALTQMPEGGVGYAAQLVEAERWSRSDYVRRYLRSMQEELPRTPAGNLARCIETARKWASEDAQLALLVKEYGRLATSDGRITPRDHARLNHATSALYPPDRAK